MTSARERYKGVFPVAPTTFTASGELNLDSQRRCIDFMIDAGSHGICILTNFSEQFVLTDAERETVMQAVLDHVAGRVPVIVTTSHFSTLSVPTAAGAQAAGAAMVMPSCHGATVRVPEHRVVDFFRAVAGAIDIPLMVQDAPVSGTALSVELLARMARGIPNLSYFKCRRPRRGDRGPVGWRRGDHLARRSRCRGDRSDDGGRVSRRDPADRRCLRGRPARRGHRHPCALVAADQLREPADRPADGQDPDAGRRYHHL
ncbi:protein of unknown function [Rhodovastum atsumiense]|nr:protein of unknown function [Rhodovastum atsumiense]